MPRPPGAQLFPVLDLSSSTDWCIAACPVDVKSINGAFFDLILMQEERVF